MENKLQKEYPEFFKLDSSILKKIVEIVNASKINNGDVVLQFTVTNKENSTYTVSDYNIVINDDNTIRRQIIGLSFIVCTAEANKRDYLLREQSFVTINWGKSKNYYSNSVFLLVDNIPDFQLATKLFDDIDNQIKRTLFEAKPGSILLRILKWVTDKLDTLLQLFLLWLFLFLFDKLFKFEVFAKTIGELTIINFILFFSVAVIFFQIVPYNIFSGIFKRVESKLITNSIFYWGDVATIYDKNKKTMNNIKWIIIIGFIVSFIAGVLTTLILR